MATTRSGNIDSGASRTRSAGAAQTPVASLHRGFEEAFRDLEEARLIDERLHARHASFDELITSHDRLHALRAELARIRAATQQNR